jgi:hypothetical protein
VPQAAASDVSATPSKAFTTSRHTIRERIPEIVRPLSAQANENAQAIVCS